MFKCIRWPTQQNHLPQSHRLSQSHKLCRPLHCVLLDAEEVTRQQFQSTFWSSILLGEILKPFQAIAYFNHSLKETNLELVNVIRKGAQFPDISLWKRSSLDEKLPTGTQSNEMSTRFAEVFIQNWKVFRHPVPRWEGGCAKKQEGLLGPGGGERSPGGGGGEVGPLMIHLPMCFAWAEFSGGKMPLIHKLLCLLPHA